MKKWVLRHGKILTMEPVLLLEFSWPMAMARLFQRAQGDGTKGSVCDVGGKKGRAFWGCVDASMCVLRMVFLFFGQFDSCSIRCDDGNTWARQYGSVYGRIYFIVARRHSFHGMDNTVIMIRRAPDEFVQMTGPAGGVVCEGVDPFHPFFVSPCPEAVVFVDKRSACSRGVHDSVVVVGVVVCGSVFWRRVDHFSTPRVKLTPPL